MKKLVSLIVVIALSAITLAACSKEQTKTFEGDVNGKQIITSLTYKGDEVLKQSTIGTLKYDDLGIDKDQAKDMLKKDEKAFKGDKGVSFKIDYKDDKAVEHIDIDYEKADIDQLKKKLGFVSVKGKNNKVSLDKTVSQMKRNGLKEKNNMTDHDD